MAESTSLQNKSSYGKVRYYKDFKDNSFMNTKVIKGVKVESDYKYLPKSLLVRLCQFCFYYLFAFPILWLVGKIKFGVKVEGKENVKNMKSGFILVGNHTQPLDSAFASVFVASPKRNYVISNKDAVSVRVARLFTKALGALPLPDEPKGLLNLSKTIDTLVKTGRTVTIYPEASIWHYCTFLRPLPSASFHYAVRSNVPIVPFAVTYRYTKGKNRFNKKPKVNITILKPVYPNLSLLPKEAKVELAQKVTSALKSVIEREGNVEYYKYLPINEKSAEND